jgi:hypothetical protein
MAPNKYSIPEISDELIGKLGKKLTPLVRKGEKLFRVAKCDPRESSFSWGDKQKRVRYLEEVGRFQTLHTYGFYGFFKPSVSEVFAQLPEDYDQEAEFFEVDGPDTASDLNAEREALDAGFHVAETILYKHKPEEVPSRDGSLSNRDFCQLGVEERLERTSWVVEAGHNEQLLMWGRHWDNPNSKYPRSKVKSWEQGQSGFMVTVGYFGEHPVSVDMQWEKIAGKWVCFYSPTSRVVDFEMIEKWMKENFEGKTKDGRWAHTNGSNFGNCLRDIGAFVEIE